jgi:hypothetical protein
VFVTPLLSFGPALLIVLLFVWLMRRAAGGITGGIGAFGRSRAQRVEPAVIIVAIPHLVTGNLRTRVSRLAIIAP